MESKVEMREQVRERYARAATTGSCCGPECCGHDETLDADLTAGTYSQADISALPTQAVEASLGCGNPTAVADLSEGETVLDLGSGGGIDVLLSARRVGETGFAYGLDMTDEMLDLAKKNAADAGVTNVEFLKGYIEAIPLPDSSVDVVISNCVINLSTDKPTVFDEISRVLRPGGRIGISDIVADDSLTLDERAERGSWVGCIAGALSYSEYRDLLESAGFSEISLTTSHQATDGMDSVISQGDQTDRRVVSNDEHGHPTPPIEAPARLLRVRLRGSSESNHSLTRSPHTSQGVPVLTNLRRHRSAYVLTGAAASWGLATVIAKSALTEIPPVALLPIQLAASVLLITPVLLARQRQEPRTRRLGRVIGLGILNPGISYALGLVGLVYITASEAVLLWATEPIMIMVLAAVTLREQVTKTQVVAAGSATIGVALIVSAPDGMSHLIGIGLTLTAVSACAVYTVLSRKWLVEESSLRVVAIQQIAALGFAVTILGAVIVSTGTLMPANISTRSWGSAVISGCLYYGIAFWLYLTGLKETPASVAGQYLNLIPLFGIAAGSVLLGEQLGARQWVGAIVLVLAVSVAVRSIPTPKELADSAGTTPGSARRQIDPVTDER